MIHNLSDWIWTIFTQCKRSSLATRWLRCAMMCSIACSSDKRIYLWRCSKMNRRRPVSAKLSKRNKLCLNRTDKTKRQNKHKQITKRYINANPFSMARPLFNLSNFQHEEEPRFRAFISDRSSIELNFVLFSFMFFPRCRLLPLCYLICLF